MSNNHYENGDNFISRKQFHKLHHKLNPEINGTVKKSKNKKYNYLLKTEIDCPGLATHFLSNVKTIHFFKNIGVLRVVRIIKKRWVFDKKEAIEQLTPFVKYGTLTTAMYENLKTIITAK